MSVPFSAGAVVYAKDISAVSAFYRDTAALRVVHAESDHVVLQSPGFQLVVVAIPNHIAESIHITKPPQRRQDTAVKLVLHVASIAAVRVAAQSLGGELDGPQREWNFQGSRVCDGHDPEGNVVQFREDAL